MEFSIPFFTESMKKIFFSNFQFRQTKETVNQIFWYPFTNIERQIEKLTSAWMLKDQLQTLAKYLENKLYYMIFKAINIIKTLLTAYLRTSKSNTERSKSLSWTAVSSKSYCSFEWIIYSATTFLERCRKVIWEKWFEKSGSRNLVWEKWLTRKKGGFIL